MMPVDPLKLSILEIDLIKIGKKRGNKLIENMILKG